MFRACYIDARVVHTFAQVQVGRNEKVEEEEGTKTTLSSIPRRLLYTPANRPILVVEGKPHEE